jgi:hypothetical protein
MCLKIMKRLKKKERDATGVEADGTEVKKMAGDSVKKDKSGVKRELSSLTIPNKS